MEDDDIYVTDNEGPSSSSAIVVGAQKRRATARIHASRPSPPQAKRVKRTTAVAAPAASAPASGNWAQVKRITGECAPFNDKSTYINDPMNRRTFMFGGIAPDDGGDNPTSDFYCCDMILMRWRNLSNSLTHRNLENPFADEKATLPLLSYPGGALVRIAVKDEIKSFILIFGGYDPAAEASSSKVIVIDPDALTWWYLNIKGEGVKPRIGPAVTSVGDEVFIFGGYKHFENDGGPISSYNILSYDSNLRIWKWRVRDRSYGYTNLLHPSGQGPSLIPANHAFGAAIPVYEGKKILLLPGRHTKNDKIAFTPANIFYYHVTNDNFQFATKDFAGSFPKNISWYFAYEYCKPNTISPPNTHSMHSNGFTSTLSPASYQSSVTLPNGKRPRGRPRKHQAPSQHTQPSMSNTITISASRSSVNCLPHSQNSNSPPTSPSVIICGWIECGNNELAPELWHLFLSPEDRVVCLNMEKHIWDLDHDFQITFFSEGQLRLLGRETVPAKGGKDIQYSNRFDIYVDLPY